MLGFEKSDKIMSNSFRFAERVKARETLQTRKTHLSRTRGFHNLVTHYTVRSPYVKVYKLEDALFKIGIHKVGGEGQEPTAWSFPFVENRH